jgi:transposase
MLLSGLSGIFRSPAEEQVCGRRSAKPEGMQLQTLLPAPSLIQLDYLVASDVLITLVARTRQPEAPCPGCGRSATRVQSRYTRTLADLPWHGIPVRLQLGLRRFFCDQPDCATAIFTERLPALVAHYSRRTCRQTKLSTRSATPSEAKREHGWPPVWG